MFLHLSVILSTGGVCSSACWDTLPGQTPPPPWADTPWADTPLGRHRPQADPSPQLLLRTVRILLECMCQALLRCL